MESPSNRDKIFGINFPRQTYALSGGDWPMVGREGRRPPITITPNPPGIYKDQWTSTYGASQDAYLSIIDGESVQVGIESVSLTEGSIYSKGCPTASNSSLWKLVDITPTESDAVSKSQQITFVVHGDGTNITNHYQDVSSVRGIGLRMPAMAAGWGRTTELIPTTVGEDGRSVDELSKLDRTSWMSGPIDLRWNPTTKVWTGFNDLIADHNFVGIGTPVFGTNPDSVGGFPFVKGRLEDVFWVRKTVKTKDINGAVHGYGSAEVTTHLEHKWFDNEEDGSAKLSSIFIIPHASLPAQGVPNVPHERGDEYNIGGEKTGDGLGIDIKTGVHFWKTQDADGPIKFGHKYSELGNKACCYNSDSKYFFGEMVFMDSVMDTCDDAARDVDGGGGEQLYPYEWIPSVQIDECELNGKHFSELVENDLKLSHRMSAICNNIASWSTTLGVGLSSMFSTLAGGHACQDAEIRRVALQAQANDALILGAAEGMIENLAWEVSQALRNFASKLQVALAACDCELTITVDEIDMSHSTGYNISPIAPQPCPLGAAASITAFDCNACWAPDINGPCQRKSIYKGGQACFPRIIESVTTEYGTCQTQG